MRHVLLLALGAVVTTSAGAQAGDPDKLVKDGGVTAAGWTGRLDPEAVARGAKITDAKFSQMGGGFHVTSGPPAIYWNASNKGTGAYTATASFTQTKAPQHAEYYGVFIGGSGLEGAKQNYLYCVVTGDGTFTVKHRIGDEVHELAGRTANTAIKKADAAGKATNEIAWKVTPERTSCLVNGMEVWGYASNALVGTGKLESLDGVAGVRVNHNLDVHIGSFSVTK